MSTPSSPEVFYHGPLLKAILMTGRFQKRPLALEVGDLRKNVMQCAQICIEIHYHGFATWGVMIAEGLAH